jgi:hypothetical protein
MKSKLKPYRASLHIRQLCIKEAVRLLSQMQFSPEYGDFRQGERVSVSLMSNWNVGHTTLRVIAGIANKPDETMHWPELTFAVSEQKSPNNIVRVLKIDPRGFGCIEDLLPGMYLLHPIKTTAYVDAAGAETQQKILILQETARLLQKLIFSEETMECIRGEMVEVKIKAHPEKGYSSFTLQITCKTLQETTIDWSGIPVCINAKGSDRRWVRFLDSHGCAAIEQLSNGYYDTCLVIRYGLGQIGTPYIQLAMDEYTSEKGYAVAAESLIFRSTETNKNNAPMIIKSADGSITATIRKSCEEEIVIAFETEVRDLDEESIGFFLIDSEGEVEKHGIVKLQALGAGNICVGRWHGKLELKGPCSLVFHLIE